MRHLFWFSKDTVANRAADTRGGEGGMDKMAAHRLGTKIEGGKKSKLTTYLWINAGMASNDGSSDDVLLDDVDVAPVNDRVSEPKMIILTLK